MTNSISYVESPSISGQELADLFTSSGIRRPVNDLARLERMLKHSNLVIAAYAQGRLIGIARAITDFNYCCYLSDLAVAKEFQRQSVGRELISRVKTRAGGQSMLLLLSAPESLGYYSKVGFETVDNGWIIKRKS